MDPGSSAALATQLDRLALCIHRPTSRRAELKLAFADLDLRPISIVVSAARFLADGRVTVADVCSLSRYQPVDNMRALLEEHRRRGVISPIDGATDAFSPSDAFRAGASVVLALQAEEAARLWSACGDIATPLALVKAHVAAGLASPLELDAFRRQVRVHHVLPDDAYGQLLGFITDLRYLRSDVHAGCLAGEGLSGPSATTLHRLWRGGSAEQVDSSLIDRGLVVVDEGRSAITESGVAACLRVEDATNAHFADVMRDLADHASTTLVSGLRDLPGEDPRPELDR
jgi:hypothetical protein